MNRIKFTLCLVRLENMSAFQRNRLDIITQRYHDVQPLIPILRVGTGVEVGGLLLCQNPALPYNTRSHSNNGNSGPRLPYAPIGCHEVAESWATYGCQFPTTHGERT